MRELVDVVVILSIITSITSIIPAIFAIFFSMQVEERLKKNFLRLKDIMDNNHERTKEVLVNMDREAEDIKTTVFKSQTELQEALKNILDDCNISGKQLEEK